MIVLLVTVLFCFSLALAQQQLALVHTASSTPDISTINDYNLLDIILVASVDGKFHALNRTSGATLWSMASFATTTSVSAPSSLAPLVRTQHVDYNPESDYEDDTPQETYIIEPQSGDIYVMTTPSSPLQRFPFSMAELVDISPLTNEHEHQTRYFVGRKETSLILMELETGKIKATLNSECPFIPDDTEESQDVDLDELEGSKPPISAPTEIYIGRTDYHISIRKKPTPSVPNPPIHNLTFSTYGPNNRDNHLQTLYRKTNDNSYVQSLPNGELIAFRGRTPAADQGKIKEKDGPDSLLWGQHFNAPIVAIFDILQAPPTINTPNPHPFILLQPRPRLPDLFPSRSLSRHHLPNLEAAYVGVVEETGSLFAMSPESFPLVVFGGNEYKDKTTKTRDKKSLPAGEGKEDESPEDVINPHESTCMLNPYDIRCIVGVRRVENGGGPEERLKSLLDGPPLPRGPLNGSAAPISAVPVGRTPGDDNDDKRWHNENTSNRVQDIIAISDGRANILPQLNKLETLLSTILFAVFSAWFLWKRVGMKVNLAGEKERKRTTVEEEEEQDRHPIGHMERDQENTSINGTASSPSSPFENTLLDNETGVHPAMSTPPPVLMNGHADPINDLTNTPTTIPPTPSPNLKREFSISLPSNLDPLPISQTPIPLLPQTPLPSTPTTATPGVIDDNEDSEAEVEPENGAGAITTPGKRKARRGKRGKKKRPGVLGGEEVGSGGSGGDKAEKDRDADGGEKASSLILTTSSPKPLATPIPSLTVSDTILGYGSHGTVVYQGSFQGRAVAVKRLLQDFVTLATREVSILQQSDDHPNVIRYYYQESHLNFFYIALELCPASLADIVENPYGHGNGIGSLGGNRREEEWREIVKGFDAKRAMRQVASGLRHLHGLGLIHRDIKPQNILISSASSLTGGRDGSGYRMLISDFGLCKKLDVDQTSFLPTANGAMAAGTVGWRAPEILRGEVKLDELSNGDDSISSRGSVATVNGTSSTPTGTTTTKTRLTKSVDIFALGCLFYYTLTNGGHPYGDRFEREGNIFKDNKQLSLLPHFCSTEESTEAQHLITQMLDPQPSQRPDTKTCLLHPFFWDPAKRLGFLQDASDRFEVMCRDPKDGALIKLEKDAGNVVGNDWHQRLDKIFIENLGKYRKYDGRSVQDLMRALRNKKHHYQDLPENVKRHLGPMPEGFLGYFTRRYPKLFMHVHGVVKDTGLHGESMFRTYFELPES
ncbi:hypothetical protein BYT27DRAFT_6766807 [Phlegmacium glaucopus]|nr:hypothetical protein BYT27DRAFT_6766807 [Phlegmacium glaucopus]